MADLTACAPSLSNPSGAGGGGAPEAPLPPTINVTSHYANPGALADYAVGTVLGAGLRYFFYWQCPATVRITDFGVNVPVGVATSNVKASLLSVNPNGTFASVLADLPSTSAAVAGLKSVSSLTVDVSSGDWLCTAVQGENSPQISTWRTTPSGPWSWWSTGINVYGWSQRNGIVYANAINTDAPNMAPVDASYGAYQPTLIKVTAQP